MKTTVEINQELLGRQREALKAVMTVDGAAKDRLRELIFQELKRVRDTISGGIIFRNGDPHGTVSSVKRYIAGKYLGGVVSIASYGARRSGSMSTYEAPRELRPGQRGGNRMVRSKRTDEMLHYGPQDRAMILNWVDAGTHPRYANGRNGKWTRSGNKTFFRMQEEGEYYRGGISARGFFDRLGNPAMRHALNELSRMVDEEFSKLLKP